MKGGKEGGREGWRKEGWIHGCINDFKENIGKEDVNSG